MAPFIICIDGIIGAGKSSLLQRLASDYPCFPEPLSEWNLLSSLYENPKLYALPFQLQVLISQFKQRQGFPDTVVLVERCPWTSRHVFAPLLLNPQEFEIYDSVYQRLAYPVHHFIYLAMDPSTAFQRIQSRSRVDRRIRLDYLQQIHERYASELISNVTVVDAHLPLDIIESHCRNLLTKKIASFFQTAYKKSFRQRSPPSSSDPGYA